MEEFFRSVPTELICAVISFLGTALSAVIAFLTARFTSNREIKKMKMQWAHDKTSSQKQALSEMVSATSRYVQSGWSKHQREAMEKISAFSICAAKDHFEALSSLYTAVASDEREDAAICLSAVIQLCQCVSRNE